MSVNGFETIGMAHDDIVTISAAFVVGESYLSCKGGTYRVSYRQFQIYAPVHAITAETVIGGFTTDDRHTIIGYIDSKSVGKLYPRTAVGVDPAVYPYVSVEFAGRSDAVFLFEAATVCGRVVDAKHRR